MTPPISEWRYRFPTLAEGDAASRELLDGAHLINLPGEQAAFRAGSACQSYVLILEGAVRVQLIGEGGREALLYRVLPGQSCVLTTCCILSGEDYPAEGIAEAPVRALAISKPAFDRGVELAPAFRRFVFANLGARVAEVIARMEEVVFRPIERRLATYLLARSAGNQLIRGTHQDIAVEVGTAREVVSRHLKRFEAAGLVQIGRSTVEVKDAEKLRCLAEGPL
jgi:CRP/FNR family transcriptional regulator